MFSNIEMTFSLFSLVGFSEIQVKYELHGYSIGCEQKP
jgi:hypothetical protein